MFLTIERDDFRFSGLMDSVQRLDGLLAEFFG
jgi:hypothetical protein